MRAYSVGFFVGIVFWAVAVQTCVAKGAPVHATGYLPKPVAEGVQFATRKKGLLGFAVLPPSYDARDAGLVMPVKNQGNCGSCWTFARAVAFEAAILKAGLANPIDLSEQDTLLNDRQSHGCSGGYMDASWEVRSGQTTEALCPYKASTWWKTCKGAKFAKAAKWGMVGGRSRAPTIEELKEALLTYGALAVTVAAGSGFSPGRDGRITTCGSRSVNHMVALVGYRTMGDGTTEFLVKNSWGTGWGAKGYAWSRQGCNKLASSVGDAALFITMAK